MVFDFDGTLVESNAVKRDVFLRIAARYHGGEAAMCDVLRTVAGDRHAVMAAFVDAARLPAQTARALVQAYSDEVDAAVAAAPAVPGAQALLEALAAAGCWVVLSSSTPLVNLATIVERRGWRSWFARLAGGPATKIQTLHAVMEEEGLTADEIIVVGDGADDRASAAAIGCTFRAVGEASGTPAGERIYTLAELQTMLLAQQREMTAS